MALSCEPHIWSCSANCNVYYSTHRNPEWQNISCGMSSVSSGHSGIVCAIDSEGIINIRVGISDAKPFGHCWISLLCEGKHVVVGNRKLVRITKDNKIFSANLPNVIEKHVYLPWSVVTVGNGILEESNLVSLDMYDNLYIASKSGDVFVYIENHISEEQSFWKLVSAGPKVPQGLLSRLKSFASLGLLSSEGDENVDACSFHVGEKYMWLIRRNSKELYQLEFDHSTGEQVSSWNRFRVNGTYTITCICGCADSMVWALTNNGQLVTVTCNSKSVSVEECMIPSLTVEDHTNFRWVSVSVGYIRHLPVLALHQRHEPVYKSTETRVPPSTLSLYPSLSEHETELISNGHAKHTGECCDDESCKFCRDQKEKTLNSSLSPVQASLQKRRYDLSSPYSPASHFGIKRKADFSHNDTIYNERVILKPKRRKTKVQLPKLKLLEGIKVSLLPQLVNANQYLTKFDPMTLQAATIKVNTTQQPFNFNLEEECLAYEEPLSAGVPCSDDVVDLEEQVQLATNLPTASTNNEAIEATTEVPEVFMVSPSPVANASTVVPTSTEHYPVQETYMEAFSEQPADTEHQPPPVAPPPPPLPQLRHTPTYETVATISTHPPSSLSPVITYGEHFSQPIQESTSFHCSTESTNMYVGEVAREIEFTAESSSSEENLSMEMMDKTSNFSK